MNISTKTVVVVGVIQCVILTLVLVLFFRYQHLLESEDTRPIPAVSQPDQ